MNCAKCKSQSCQIKSKQNWPNNCPMWDEGLISRGLALYKEGGNEEMYANGMKGMRHVMGRMSRVMEAVSFCKANGYKKIGVAYCSGMLPYGRMVVDIFEEYGFEVVSAGCKTAGLGAGDFIDLEKYGIKRADPPAPQVDAARANAPKKEFKPLFPEDGKIPEWPTFDPKNVKDRPRPPMNRASCNPLGQAEAINSENTEFNIVVGLCVGHDTLFLKQSEAPCTVVVVKDRLYHDICKPAVEAAYEYCVNDVNKDFYVSVEEEAED